MVFQKLFNKVVLFALLAVTGAAVAQSPKVLLLIANQGKTPAENAVFFVDPVAKKVLYTVPVGGLGQPHNVAVSDDGKYACTTNLVRYVQWSNYPGSADKIPATSEKHLNYANGLPSDSVSIIDIKNHKLLYTVDIGPGAEPHGIGFGGGKCFFTAEGWKLVGRVDPVLHRVDWMGGIGQERIHELVVTHDGTRIFTANIGSSSIAAIAPWDPATDKQTFTGKEDVPPWNTTIIPAGRGCEGIGMTPDEKEVWVLNRADNTATVVDVATKKVIDTVPLNTKDPLRIAFTPDGARVLVSDTKRGDVVIYDRASRKEIKRIANVGSQAHGLVVSPDGAFAYAGVEASADVAIINLKTYEIVGRIPLNTGKKAFDGIDGMALVTVK